MGRKCGGGGRKGGKGGKGGKRISKFAMIALSFVAIALACSCSFAKTIRTKTVIRERIVPKVSIVTGTQADPGICAFKARLEKRERSLRVRGPFVVKRAYVTQILTTEPSSCDPVQTETIESNACEPVQSACEPVQTDTNCIQNFGVINN